MTKPIKSVYLTDKLIAKVNEEAGRKERTFSYIIRKRLEKSYNI